MTKGKFVVIEGMDGAGKTTLSKNICNELKKNNVSCFYTREPGGNKVSEKIRDIIFSEEGSKMSIRAETLLFLASRAINVSDSILPNLKKNNVVLCDRFFHSTNVYQGHTRAPKLIDGIRKSNMFSIGEAVPDLVLYIKVSAKEGYRRKKLESEDKNWLDNQSFSFYEKVSKSYDDELNSSNWNIVTLDGEQDEDTLTKKAIKEVFKILKN